MIRAKRAKKKFMTISGISSRDKHSTNTPFPRYTAPCYAEWGGGGAGQGFGEICKRLKGDSLPLNDFGFFLRGPWSCIAD